ncbi:MAG: hypothetical protein ACRC0E_02740 [Soonwooa sp.]
MKKILLILGSIFIIAIIGLIYLSGYKIPNTNKHPQIPYFPKTTKADQFVNKQVDSLYINNYYLIPKTDYILINYKKIDNNNNETRIAINKKNLKPVYDFYSKGSVSYGYENEKNWVYFSSASSENKDLKPFVLDINTLKTHDLSATELKNKKLSFDGRLIAIKMAGDHGINMHNIQLFDKAVTGNSLGRISYGTPSSSVEGREKVYEKNSGIFTQSRDYFFKMKLKNKEVEFKTDLFYNSGIYFDELNSPKTDKDTLLYYSDKRFYQFYKKK